MILTHSAQPGVYCDIPPPPPLPPPPSPARGGQLGLRRPLAECVRDERITDGIGSTVGQVCMCPREQAKNIYISRVNLNVTAPVWHEGTTGNSKRWKT